MKRVMLVEDEENLYLAIKLNLELENYNVTSVCEWQKCYFKVSSGQI